ncbi:hypothetical protein LX99_01898 [Mucilaginibacter oryzae]|uniref:Uncharacterized protein n=1 Tax=Mucilaginibacter oryzae TaxID=468058 RepID=A0A316HC21_9SPHI|nr:hypothetical protein [Mucilaginibacter oryzae]PWK78058.1 hypothetical protein LX99_01898 [Mucilaginibacter oryzae]
MNLLSLLLAITINGNSFLKTDTTDYWHVAYNSKIIARYTAFDKAPIRIKKSAVKDGDILLVTYGDDTPGDAQHTGLYILGANKKRIMITTAKEGEPLKFYLNYALATQKQYHLKDLDFFYFDDKRDHFIFKLIIQ